MVKWIFGIGCMLMAILLSACDHSPVSTTTEAGNDERLPYKSALLPGVHEADSAYVLYYEKAGESRYYRTLKVKDQAVLQLIKNAANDTILPSAASCISEGKIHLYGKGEEVYTLYFSLADTCTSLSFIHTGIKYSTPMPAEVLEFLYQSEHRAQAD